MDNQQILLFIQKLVLLAMWGIIMIQITSNAYNNKHNHNVDLEIFIIQLQNNVSLVIPHSIFVQHALAVLIALLA